MIEPERIRAVIKSVGKLSDCPMGASMHQLGLKNADLQKIQYMIARHHQYTVSDIFYSDTVYTITDKLNKKPQRENA